MQVVRLFTGADGQSHFEAVEIELGPASSEGRLSAARPARDAVFAETPPGTDPGWHTAPHRQYVVTLGGELEFMTRDGATQRIGPGDVLLAEDTTGGGHCWRILGDAPWRRLYVRLDPANAG